MNSFFKNWTIEIHPMFLFISHFSKACYLSPQDGEIKSFSKVLLSENLEVSPLVVWQSDGSIDYLETDKFGSVLRREIIWYSLRFFECPIVEILEIPLENIPHPRVAVRRLKRLIEEGRTLLDYLPEEISLYFDLRPKGVPFYRLESGESVNAITGERLQFIGSEIEEICFHSSYRPYPVSSRKINLVLIYRQKEERLYLFNSVSGNLIQTAQLIYKATDPPEDGKFLLGIFQRKGFFARPTPNLSKKFYQHLPEESLQKVIRVNLNPWDSRKVIEQGEQDE